MVMRIWGLILLNCNQNLTTEQKVLIIGCTLFTFFFFLIWEWNMTQNFFFEKRTQDAYIHNSTCIQIKSHKHARRVIVDCVWRVWREDVRKRQEISVLLISPPKLHICQLTGALRQRGASGSIGCMCVCVCLPH